MHTDRIRSFETDDRRGSILNSANGQLIIRDGRISVSHNGMPFGGLIYFLDRFSTAKGVWIEINASECLLNIVNHQGFRRCLGAITPKLKRNPEFLAWIKHANQELEAVPLSIL